jgi:hypothetical protein
MAKSIRASSKSCGTVYVLLLTSTWSSMRGLVLGVLGVLKLVPRLSRPPPPQPLMSHLRLSQAVFSDEDCLIPLYSSAGSADSMRQVGMCLEHRSLCAFVGSWIWRRLGDVDICIEHICLGCIPGVLGGRCTHLEYYAG